MRFGEHCLFLARKKSVSEVHVESVAVRLFSVWDSFIVPGLFLILPLKCLRWQDIGKPIGKKEQLYMDDPEAEGTICTAFCLLFCNEIKFFIFFVFLKVCFDFGKKLSYN